ncbi:Anthranilate 1,2-dioxygenase electron transfer component [bacterium HR27]|nr:Anthranilate 1,2-dioxygenase electron transfer component [bacterium HR27]
MINPSSPLGTRVLTFLIRVYPTGVVSPRLAELPAGSSLVLQVPYGGAYLRLAPTLWFIAGGTGIAPIRAMLRALLHTHDRPAVRVVYGAATPQHLAFAAELAKLVERLGGDITFTVDRPTDGWTGLIGPVTAHLALDQLAEDHQFMRCFVAGPPGMVTAVERLLVDAGVPRNRIHADPFA